MRCPHCGRPNYIYALDCRHCGKAMRTQQELDAALQSVWADLPPKVKDKVQKDYQNNLNKYLQDMESVRRSAQKDIARAAIVLGLIGLCNGFIIIPDILLGGLAGFIIRKKGGGAFWGMTLFAASYLVSFALKWNLGWTVDPWKQDYPEALVWRWPAADFTANILTCKARSSLSA